MIKRLKKYLLLLWIISLGASGQLLAHSHSTNNIYALLKNTSALQHSGAFVQQGNHTSNFIYSLSDEENNLLDSREAEIEEEDDSSKHHKHLANKNTYVTLSKWFCFNNLQISLFDNHSLHLSHNKLFIVFCAYII